MDRSNVTNRFLLSQGRQVFVQEKSLDKPVKIVFIHGRCLSVRSWKRQFESELLDPFGLIAFDLFGHGSSDNTTDLHLYSLAGSVQLLLDLIDQLQLTNFILVGHSLGGHIALQALPRLPYCRGVFCMTMPLTIPIDFGKMYCNVNLLVNVYQANPTQTQLSAYIDSLFQSSASEKPLFVEDDFLRTDPAVHTGILQGLLAGDFGDEVDLIRTSGVPVALVQGEREQVHRLDYLNAFDLSLWREQPLLLPAAGHMVQWENPDLVNSLLVSFIAEVVSSQ
ncbi:alpha/beta fold hydrolase [Spirosoma agri]|uniref:Alpha/beta hydrolase n=1 Tax=Spirosoma agri TaxID=1987381 RepID=A0A6M0IJN2_9BACT|nr:alpha/beta hydrolase [Spirosoma agri]NEU67133.1 alpha/beta hydrolase [Spirosoma agri]